METQPLVIQNKLLLPARNLLAPLYEDAASRSRLAELMERSAQVHETLSKSATSQRAPLVAHLHQTIVANFRRQALPATPSEAARLEAQFWPNLRTRPRFVMPEECEWLRPLLERRYPPALANFGGSPRPHVP